MAQVTQSHRQLADDPKSQHQRYAQKRKGATDGKEKSLTVSPVEPPGQNGQGAKPNAKKAKRDRTKSEPLKGRRRKSDNQINGKNIAENLKNSIEAVLRNTKTAGMMTYWDFYNSGTSHGCKSREESMHFSIAIKTANALCTIGL